MVPALHEMVPVLREMVPEVGYAFLPEPMSGTTAGRGWPVRDCRGPRRRARCASVGRARVPVGTFPVRRVGIRAPGTCATEGEKRTAPAPASGGNRRGRRTVPREGVEPSQPSFVDSAPQPSDGVQSGSAQYTVPESNRPAGLRRPSAATVGRCVGQSGWQESNPLERAPKARGQPMAHTLMAERGARGPESGRQESNLRSRASDARGYST